MPSYFEKSTLPSIVSTPASTLMSTLLLSTPGISRTTVRACWPSKMSVVGTNTREGTVDSCFFSTSRFCCTCSSCGDMYTSITRSVDGNAARLVGLGPRDEEREDAVAVLGLDGVGIDLHRHR